MILHRYAPHRGRHYQREEDIPLLMVVGARGSEAQESTFTQTYPTWTLRSRRPHRALQEPRLRTWKKQELEEERGAVS